ncbi:MAG: ATP-binding protein, partial [Planctomycetaceae bacterium]|nr:ATP-binding protein [Planctomycetaceae bacterium]
MKASDMEIDLPLRRALQDRLGAERFDLWFGKEIRFEVDAGRVVVVTPSIFLQEWLRRNFRQLLAETAAAVLARPVDIEIRVAAHPSAGSPCTDAGAKCSPLALPHEPPAERGDSPPHLAPRHSPPAGGTATAASVPVVLPVVAVAAAPRLAPRSADGRATTARRFATFDSFVVGNSNRLAWTSARMAGEGRANFSPLLIYGPSGSGKTHLLEAIWSHARSGPERTSAVFLTAEQFTSYFVDAVRKSGLPNFRRKYRGVQLLLIDDLQFFSGKRATLVELLYTINTLTEEGRQVVLSADRPPSELGELGRELVNRLQGGMVCGVEAPDYDVRLGALRRLAIAGGLELTAEVESFVAREIPADGRILAGAVNRLTVAQLTRGRPLSLAAAQESLADLIRATARTVRLQDIDTAICH